MNKKQEIKKAIDFQEYLKSQLKKSEIKKHYDECSKQLEIAYQILQLRKKKKMSQNELAQKIGTKQSNIARIETGKENFTVGTLQKIANVFKYDLKIEFVK